jgi:hypothetical protein
VKTRDDNDLIVNSTIQQTIRKTPKEKPTSFAPEDGIGKRPRCYGVQPGADGGKKLIAKTTALSLVPSIRIVHIRRGGWTEDDRLHGTRF